MRYLKQSTTATVILGPFVDKDDGVTPETALTPTVRVSKNAGAFANRSSASSIAHMENGYYSVPLNATDTGTLGRVRLTVTSSANHLPVYEDFMIVPANVYDSLIGGNDSLEVDATAISGSATAANNVEANIANLDASIAGLNDISVSDVATEIADALGTDTIAELSSIPGSTPTLKQAVMLLYMSLRNSETASSSTATIKKDDGTTVGSATLSDSAGTFTKGKYT